MQFKVGDAVIIYKSLYGRDTYREDVIERETKTLWVLGGGSKYKKATNALQGLGAWDGLNSLLPATTDNRKRLAQQRVIKKIEATDFNALSGAAISAIYDIIKKET